MKINVIKYCKEHKHIIFLIIFFGFFHIFMHTDYWDDAVFMKVMEDYDNNLIQFTIDRYNNWSSRIFIEMALAVIAALPNIIWKIINIFMIVFLYKNILWMLVYFFECHEEKVNTILVGLICAYPFSAMASTGWIATTMNYLWVLSLGLYVLKIFILSISSDQRISRLEAITSIFALLYSSSFETMAFLLFVIFSVCILYIKLKEKRSVSKFIYLETAIVVLMLIYIFLCPGNKLRPYTDIEIWMPEYLQLNIIDKVRMGIVTAFMNVVSIPSVVFFFLNVICFIGVFFKTKRKISRVIAAIPTALDVAWTLYFMVNYVLGNKIMTYQIPKALLSKGTDFWEQILILFSVFLWIGAVFYSLYVILNTKKDFVKAIIVLGIGFVPELVVGMTPTVVTSMLRTMIYLHVSMITIGVLSYHEVCGKINDTKFLKLGIKIIIVMGIVLNVLQMTRHLMVYG